MFHTKTDLQLASNKYKLNTHVRVKMTEHSAFLLCIFGLIYFFVLNHFVFFVLFSFPQICLSFYKAIDEKRYIQLAVWACISQGIFQSALNLLYSLCIACDFLQLNATPDKQFFWHNWLVVAKKYVYLCINPVTTQMEF